MELAPYRSEYLVYHSSYEDMIDDVCDLCHDSQIIYKIEDSTDEKIHDAYVKESLRTPPYPHRHKVHEVEQYDEGRVETYLCDEKRDRQ